eukprot:TRINITY_DN73629_c0_g1_i1.p2 TRINITY_DN73629_c0_g1~~TRINITY_DN73629_c0_g1_i1.p2  ORF type:complete len:283 (-),score=69.98 TRINITY_DN73629_c0_g1_i1:35-757(-)
MAKNPYAKKKKKADNPKGARAEAMRLFEEMMDLEAQEPLGKAIKHMRTLLTDVEVQRQGCYALGYKAVTHGRAVIKWGGLEAALDAMNRHLQCERLQFDGLQLIWRLAMDQDGAQMVLDLGGLHAVISALSQHTESVRVQEEAVGALRWLAELDAHRVMDEGGLEAAVRVMENLPQFSWVQMWACGALGCFSKLDASRVEDLGGFVAIRAAVKKHELSTEVQRLAEIALKFDPSALQKIS